MGKKSRTVETARIRENRSSGGVGRWTHLSRYRPSREASREYPKFPLLGP
jgi:hypothetical protein